MVLFLRSPNPHIKQRVWVCFCTVLGIVVCALFGPITSAHAQSFEWDGYIQGVGVLLDQSSQDQLDPSTNVPLNEERFLVRRSRLIVHAHQGAAFGRFEIDANTIDGFEVQPVRAFAGIQWGETPTDTSESDTSDTSHPWPWVAGQVGLFNTPFGHGVQASSRQRAFLERSHVENALFPGVQDLGAQVFGQWRFVRYQVALMNGSTRSDAQWKGQDPTSGFDVVGRFGVVVPAVQHVRIDAGASILQGQGLSPGTVGTKDSVQWRDSNENGIVELSELQPIAGRAGRSSEVFDRSALGVDLTVLWSLPHVGDGQLEAEVFWSLNLDRSERSADPVVLGRDLREFGYFVSWTQNIREHGLLGVRFDTYNPDADAFEQRAAALVPVDPSRSSWSAVVGWTTLDPFMLTLEYNFNDNSLGRDTTGAPTRLEDDRLLIRAQVEL